MAIMSGSNDTLIGEWSYPIRVSGEEGKTGNGIEYIKELYALGTSDTEAPEEWSEEKQAVNVDYKYLWNKEVIYYSNSEPQETTPKVVYRYTKDGVGV
jgi:hypothetical protein